MSGHKRFYVELQLCYAKINRKYYKILHYLSIFNKQDLLKQKELGRIVKVRQGFSAMKIATRFRISKKKFKKKWEVSSEKKLE